ncbi:hypothetical protein ACFX19_001343 [Malus domestica]
MEFGDPTSTWASLISFWLLLAEEYDDAYILPMDRKGFEVLSKVPSSGFKDGFDRFEWKEFRPSLKEEARDVETFCRQLVEMEEQAVKDVSGHSGLA